MPAGMELFPAADDAAWQLIKEVIDGSDYYVVIIGGRYGSMDETGIGYTEKEYDYAVSQKKLVIPLLHKNPDNLPRDKTETDAESWEKLKKFRKRVEKSHTCVYWITADDLKAQVIVGLTSATKRHPAIGWVRADRVRQRRAVWRRNRRANSTAVLRTVGEHVRFGSHGAEVDRANRARTLRPWRMPGNPIDSPPAV